MNGTDDICCNCKSTHDVRSGTLVIKAPNKNIRVETQMCLDCIRELDVPVYFYETNNQERYVSVFDKYGNVQEE